MAFIKTSKAKGVDYYSVCESYRENGKVKHRTLEYIGDLKKLKEYALKGYLAMREKQEDVS